MPQTRSFLLLALLFVGYLLWNQWQQDYHTPAVTATPAAAATQGKAKAPDLADSSVPQASSAPAVAESAGTADAPGTPSTPAAAPVSAPTRPSVIKHGALVTVTTDVLRVTIDSRGGSIIRADLLKYPKKLKSSHSVRLLNDSRSRFFVAQDGLLSRSGDAPDQRAMFHAAKASYQLEPDQKTLAVDLDWTNGQGIKVVKQYTFTRGSYVVGLEQRIDNGSSKPWTGWPYRQLQRVVPPPTKHSNFLAKYSDQSRYSFFGAAWYGPDKKFNTIKFEDFNKDGKQSLNRKVTGGWVAMEQHYFMAAWLPADKPTQQFSTHVVSSATPTRYLIRDIGPGFTVAPGASTSTKARLYAGPKLRNELGRIAPGLDLSVDYGMFTVVAAPMHMLLTWFHGLTGNWGLAIILVVLLINVLLYKLNAAQYRSAAKTRKLKPRMDALKERYGDDKQKLQQATMELYKKEKINPVAGCFPILIQIPVFFALYTVLRESVELRQAPFFGWIHDLSAADPYFVLPVLYMGVMLMTQRLMPMSAGMDATQAKIMKWMPIIYPVFFAFFPAGLVLYYLVNGLCRVGQQWWVMRKFDAEDGKRRGKAKPT
ncbi:membrane protein insertase YidC [Oleiagrimonas sp.]|jgi:YidC/Oxa1 family membrane protein insertase|uniref:membrane protein insertase YidC n=1 Tax=Oleiagrimonas sp. TaxID=2010330 RepID=UPI0026377E40|nr:membrane protein insertase YidC [Oleiagrimonas sp.]MDA3913533.1 membrane protein insertase YidC [Oleiagrimonas sp.]